MVVGAIEWSHIPIIAPSIDEYTYVNRKQYHLIKIQAGVAASLYVLGG